MGGMGRASSTWREPAGKSHASQKGIVGLVENRRMLPMDERRCFLPDLRTGPTRARAWTVVDPALVVGRPLNGGRAEDASASGESMSGRHAPCRPKIAASEKNGLEIAVTWKKRITRQPGPCYQGQGKGQTQYCGGARTICHNSEAAGAQQARPALRGRPLRPSPSPWDATR